MNFAKIGALFILFCSTSLYLFAKHSEPQNVNDSDSTYTSITSNKDTLYTHDSILVIHTVCAPICSSHVRVYNKEWEEIGLLKAPFRSIFPEAYVEDGKILWRDNDKFDYTPQ